MVEPLSDFKVITSSLEAADEKYVPPIAIGEIIRGYQIGTVVATKSSVLPVGCYVMGWAGWTELAIVSDKAVEKIEVPKNGVITDYLSILGMLLFS
jgi:NADPH-dependent curcumin reductase CurA